MGVGIASPAVVAATAGPMVKDAEVEAAIKKGVEYLLSKKGTDNFESEGSAAPEGAETALALYALLQAGQDVVDPRLKANSPELAKVVKYLTKLDPQSTMTAALQIGVLALVPRGKDVDAAMERAREFLQQTTGVDGGHGPGWARSFDDRDLDEAWGEFFDAKYPEVNDNAASARFNRARTRLDDVVEQAKLTVGGWQPELNRLEKIVKDRDPTVAGAAARLNRELNDLNAYANEARQAGITQINQNTLQQWRGLLDELKRTRGQLTGAEAIAKVQDQMDATQRMIASGEFALQVRARPLGDVVDSAYAAQAYAALAADGVALRGNPWGLEDRFWRMTQKTAGNWGYWPDGAVRSKAEELSGGAAGLASLLAEAEATDSTLKADKAVDLAMKWLDASFAPSGDVYYMYNVERVGMMTGRRSFNNMPWYVAGARAVMGAQKPDGHWEGTFAYASPITATAYGVLYLARGRNPLVVNKLEYKGVWNTRYHDAANLANWLGKKMDRGFNWQTVKLEDGAEALDEAPILLIEGTRDPKFTPDEIAKLRAYVLGGGLILSNADVNSGEFTAAMQAAAGQMIEGRKDMKPVDEKSELLSNWTVPKRAIRASALTNGLRAVWVQGELDWSGVWQKKATGAPDDYEALGNIYGYATSMTVRSRLDVREVEVPKVAPARTIAVARVKYQGNWNPEPMAWKRFSALAKVQFNTNVEVKEVEFGALDAKVTPVASLTGFGKVTFGADAVAAVQKYVAAGGVLVVDAAGGDKDFAAAAKALIKAAVKGTMDDVRDTDGIYSGVIAGAGKDAKKIDGVTYRPFWIKLNKANTTPHLQKVEVGGKIAVVYSEDDIGSGFLGTDTWGIAGYSPESSVALMRNILLGAGK